MSNEKKPFNNKFIAIIAVLLALIIAISVVFVVKNKDDVVEETTTIVETTVTETQPESTTVAETEITETTTNRKTVKEFVKNDLGISNAVISKGEKLSNGTVYFIDEPMDGSGSFFKSRSIVVDTGKRFLTKEIFNGVGKADIYYADVDGEKGKEIIVHMSTGGNGGYGIYVNYIFGLKNDMIYEYYNSEKDDRLVNVFDSKLEAPYKAIIFCKDTGYEKVIDFTNNNFSEKKYVFDNEGKPIVEYGICFDSFYRFEPKDVDKDGVYEIFCRQYASLGSHASGIGYTELVLNFDGGPEITNTKFFEGPDEVFMPR